MRHLPAQCLLLTVAAAACSCSAPRQRTFDAVVVCKCVTLQNTRLTVQYCVMGPADQENAPLELIASDFATQLRDDAVLSLTTLEGNPIPRQAAVTDSGHHDPQTDRFAHGAIAVVTSEYAVTLPARPAAAEPVHVRLPAQTLKLRKFPDGETYAELRVIPMDQFITSLPAISVRAR